MRRVPPPTPAALALPRGPTTVRRRIAAGPDFLGRPAFMYCLCEESLRRCNTSLRPLNQKSTVCPRLPAAWCGDVRRARSNVCTRTIVSTFLQGSYRRGASIRPRGDKSADVDLVAMMKLMREEYTPQEAIDLFVPFLDNHYKRKWEFQGRSIGIGRIIISLTCLTHGPGVATDRLPWFLRRHIV